MTVVPGVPGTTTSTDGTVLVTVEGKGDDAGVVAPAGRVVVEGRGDDAGSVPPAGIAIVEVKDDTTGECCKVTGTTTVDVEEVTIGERLSLIHI